MKTIMFIILLMIVVSCNDTIKPVEKDLEKYPWMQSFLFQMSNFEGIEHNLDLGTFSFYFNSKLSKKEYFFKIDSVASVNKWETIKNTENNRVLIKKSNAYPAANFNDTLSITYSNENKRFLFECK